MTCQTCGGPPSTSDCVTCGTPAGAPAVAPGVKTFGLRGVGIAASVLVGLTVVADVLTYTTPIVGRSLTRDPENIDGAVAAVIYEGLTASASLIGLLCAGILVTVWLYRAHRNLDAFPGAYPAMRHGWAIGGWFIPFANFVLPFRVMSDVVRGSLWRGRPLALAGVWWAAFLVSSIGGNLVGRRSGSLPYPETTDDVAAYADAYGDEIGASLVVLVASVVAGALLVVLITRVSAAQETRIGRGGPGTVLPGMSYPVPPAYPPAGYAGGYAPPPASPPAGYAPPPGPNPPPTPREPGEPAASGGATIGS